MKRRWHRAPNKSRHDLAMIQFGAKEEAGAGREKGKRLKQGVTHVPTQTTIAWAKGDVSHRIDLMRLEWSELFYNL